MAKLTLVDIVGGYQSASSYNANNALIEAAIENTLSLDGTTPNQMGADVDMNSFNIANVNALTAASVVATSISLNGQALSTTTTLTGGLAASEVTYNAGTLQAALDDDYIRDDENGTIAGNLTVTGLVSAGTNLSVTGNITVSGTVDGIDIATLDTDAVKRSTAVTDHVRAGNTQYVKSGQNFSSFDVVNSITENTFETVGPTGSGATNIIADMDDAIAAGATIVLFKARFRVVQDATSNAASLILYCASNDVTPSIANDKDYTHYVEMKSATEGDEIQEWVDIMVPVDSSGIFKCTWGGQFNLSLSETISLYYKGFITD